MKALAVTSCERCGRTVFPRRLLCPDCGSADWKETATTGGAVEETTVLRRIPGADVPPVALGTVRLDEGPVVVARREAAGGGDRVSVLDDGGAPVARPA